MRAASSAIAPALGPAVFLFVRRADRPDPVMKTVSSARSHEAVLVSAREKHAEQGTVLMRGWHDFIGEYELKNSLLQFPRCDRRRSCPYFGLACITIAFS